MHVLPSVLLVATVLGCTLGSSISRPKRAVDVFLRAITYKQEGGANLDQTVTVGEHEARFQAKGGMDAVIDYKQQLFIYTDATAGDVCHVAKFDVSIVPGLGEIKQLLENENTFVKPEDKRKMTFGVSRDQTKPKLLALASQLCEGRKLVRMETIETTRAKREVGAGEVVVIIVAIVLLGFLG